jgi:uncharacterized membrane protein
MNVEGPRLGWLDATRGVAVLTMIGQHVAAWFWDRPGAMEHVWSHSPTLVSISGIGAVAAPLFLLLAGYGATLSSQRHPRPDRTLVASGAFLVFTGYVVNFATDAWFSPGSWYVLHLLGLGQLLSPALVRLPRGALVVVAFGLVLGGALGQHLLGTPWELLHATMRDTSMPWGMLRRASVEGHFPVLPWLAPYVIGVWAGRQEGDGLRRAALVCLLAAAVFAGLRWVPPPSCPPELWQRLWWISVRHYPTSPPTMLFLSGVGLLIAWVLARSTRMPRVVGTLASVGRVALTLFVAHVVVLRQWCGAWFGMYHAYSANQTLAAVLVSIGGSVGVALLWRRADYRFGLEWLRRRWVQAVTRT